MKENLFSCSRTSKNAFLFDWSQSLFEMPRSLCFCSPLFYQRESGAKVRRFFVTSKFFWNFFQKKISEPSFYHSLTPFSVNHFTIFRRESGCKVTAKKRHFQIFSRLFLIFFGPFFAPSSLSVTCEENIFSKNLITQYLACIYNIGMRRIDNWQLTNWQLTFGLHCSASAKSASSLCTRLNRSGDN